MPRLTPVFVTVLALAVLTVSPAAPQAAAKEEKVTVDVKCRAKDEGPTKVTVDPWLLWIKPGDEIRWKLKITDSVKNSIVVEAKDGTPWPYEKRKHEGHGEEGAHAKDWKGAPGPEFNYNITVSCNGYEFVIDPRVRVQ